MSIISASTLTTTALQLTADTAGTLVFRTGATPTTALTLGADQSATFAGTVNFATASFTNLSYTGTFTGGTGVVNLGSGQFYKDASGNIGIGTASPNDKLHVSSGAIRISNTSNALLELFTNAGSRFGYLFGTSSSFQLAAESTASSVLSFSTAGAERMRIDSSGNVIVGATSQIGSAKFGVQRSGAGECIRWTDGATGGAITTVVSFGTNLNSDAFSFTTASTERMRIDSSGNVGIGTSSPAARLHTLSSNDETIRLATSTINPYISLYESTTRKAYIQFVSSGTVGLIYDSEAASTGHVFLTQGAERLRIKPSGTIILQGGSTSATGTGITFPATQSASSDANTLDDYEEGTFTATLKGTTTNPTTPVTTTGRYTKIGRLVYVDFSFDNISNVGAAGTTYVDGLPFTSITGNPAYGICAAYSFSFGAAGRTSLSVQVTATSAYIYSSGSDVTWSNLTHSAGTGRYLSITATYTV